MSDAELALAYTMLGSFTIGFVLTASAAYAVARENRKKEPYQIAFDFSRCTGDITRFKKIPYRDIRD